MSLALRIENGEIDGWRQRHRLDLLAGRAAIGLHRVLVSSIRAGTAAPASRSGVWLCRLGPAPRPAARRWPTVFAGEMLRRPGRPQIVDRTVFAGEMPRDCIY